MPRSFNKMTMNMNNYLEQAQELGYLVKQQGALKVFKVTENTNIEADVKFFKGMILDNEGNVVCPGTTIPMNAEKMCQADVISILTDVNNKIFQASDGVMLRLFYYQDEWHVATLGSTHANSRWNSDLTFRQMFDDISDSHVDFNLLNKDLCYFVQMQHRKHYTYTHIENNCLTLFDVVHKSSFSRIPVESAQAAFKFVRSQVANPTEDEVRQLMELREPEPILCNNHGFVAELQDGRILRVVTANCLEAESLFPNVANLNHHWVHLMGREDYERLPYDVSVYLRDYVYGKQHMYLKYFPQFTSLFLEYERRFERLLYDIIDIYYEFLAKGKKMPFVRNRSQLSFVKEMIVHFNGEPKNHVDIAYYLVGQDIPRLIYLIKNVLGDN